MYCNQTDIERAISSALALRLFDDGNDGQVDSSTLDDAIDDAVAEIDGYLGRSYNLTTLKANVPPTVRRIAVDLVVQFGYLRRPEFLNDRGETPWHGRHKAALQRLADLRDGKWRIDIDGVPEHPAQVDGGVYQGPDDTYTDGIGCGIWSHGFGDF